MKLNAIFCQMDQLHIVHHLPSLMMNDTVSVDVNKLNVDVVDGNVEVADEIFRAQVHAKQE